MAELAKLAPAIDWPAFFAAVGVPSLARSDAKLDVSVPSFVRGLNAQVAGAPLDTWRAYLRWSVLRGSANWLSEPYLREALALQQALTGTGVALPRWKRAAAVVDATMGEALGKAYVATEFPPESKARMMEMVSNLQAAFAERIRTRTWMSEATKKQAIAKLEAVLKKIGYPDTWRDYSGLEIDPALSGYENLRRAQTFEVRRQLAQIGKPVDRTEWGMSPPTVNAYYNPNINEIVFPAGILQPPRFDPDVDDAFNYGAAGMVIGHELTHGFDDEGRQYDARGNLRDWWTAEDAKHFDVEARKVERQYSAYVGIDTLHLNGRMTLGENIADIGGLTIAYHAWKRSLNGRPSPVIDGFTGEQRFFLGHAQVWRVKMREAMLRTTVLSNEHSPSYWRVDGPLSVMPEFAEAFHCKPGDRMRVGDEGRASIW